MARVLIVDDDMSFHELLGMLLGEFGGHQTLSAVNGAKGLEMIASSEVPGSPPGAGFDLIITDLRMPVMTGTEMTAALRGRGCTVPIILITGVVDPPRIEGVRVLSKPFNIDDFNGAVLEALGKNVV